MTGTGRSYRERQRERVKRPECGKELARGSLSEHRQNQHGVAKGGARQEGDNPKTYMMAFPEKSGPMLYTVEGCSGRATKRTAMQMHFLIWHFRYTVVILEYVNLPHPRCPMYDMLVKWWFLNGRHQRTEK